MAGPAAAVRVFNVFIANMTTVRGFLGFIPLILFPHKHLIKIPSVKAYKDA